MSTEEPEKPLPPAKKSCTSERTEELLELYKEAYFAWVDLSCANDADWLQAHKDVPKYPCECCTMLHCQEPEGPGARCGLCSEVKCDIQFLKVDRKNCKKRFVDLVTNYCDACEDRLAWICTPCLTKSGASELGLKTCKLGCCFFCEHESAKEPDLPCWRVTEGYDK